MGEVSAPGDQGSTLLLVGQTGLTGESQPGSYPSVWGWRCFCHAKTLLCGWRAHFCRFNADLPLHLNHVVASPFPPHVKAGSGAHGEPERGCGGPTHPGARVLCALPSHEPQSCSSVHSMRTDEGSKHSGPVLGRACTFFSAVAGSLQY